MMTCHLIGDRAIPRLLRFCMRTEALSGLLELRVVVSIVLEQPMPDFVEIVGQDPKPDIPLKPRPAFVGAPIQPMVF